MLFVSAFLSLLPLAYAAQVPTFKPPSAGVLIPSSNYGNPSNGSLPKSTVVPGKAFDRLIIVVFENTDAETATSSSTFTGYAAQGITLSNYNAVTHPSEPNYIAMSGGDYFGLADDALYNIPTNVSTIVDLLVEKNVSWAAYQESMPSDGDPAFNASLPNYLNTSAPPYVYYVRKHNPLIIYDSIASVPARAQKMRNMNDFAADVNATALPQWMFLTPNLVDDAHDTDIGFASQWADFFITPLLKDTRFNDNRTLIVITFDENETQTANNRVLTILLGGAVPARLHGTTDSTFYTHYSLLSTAEANWGLGCLGRGDSNKQLSNVFSFVADATGYKNVDLKGNEIPLTNASGTTPGPLNPNAFIPFLAPNMSSQCAGGGKVFVASNVNTSLTTAPSPVNLTAANLTVPASGPLNPTATAPAGSATATAKTGGAIREVRCLAAAAMGAVLAVVELYA